MWFNKVLKGGQGVKGMTTKTLIEALVDAYDCGQMDAGSYSVADETAFNFLCCGVYVYVVLEFYMTDDGSVHENLIGISATLEHAEGVIRYKVEEKVANVSDDRKERMREYWTSQYKILEQKISY